MTPDGAGAGRSGGWGGWGDGGGGGRGGRVVSHGIDLVDVARIARMLDEHGDHFLQRVYTEGERAHGRSGRRYAEHLAVRFAAKEAALKALGTGLTRGIRWTDVEVVRGATGEPGLRLHACAAAIARERSIGAWSLALTHANGVGVASVIALSAE